MSHLSDSNIERSKTRWITHSALHLSFALALPIALHFINPLFARAALPMHVPVLLAGFLVGPASGLMVGLLAPGLSHLMTGMPPAYAVPLMSLELPIYGLIAGLTYVRMRMNIYVSLLIAMVFGRIMFGLGLLVLGLFMELPYTAARFFSTGGTLLTGLPGLVLQLVLIPIIVAAIRRRSS